MDIWVFGVLLYGLISDQLPFPYADIQIQASNLEVHSNLIMSHPLNFNKKHWKHVSPSLVDLLAGMLHKDPDVRLTIDQVVQHEWLRM